MVRAAIKQDFGVTNVFADAWSAPGFMKTNGATGERRPGVRRRGRELLKR